MRSLVIALCAALLLLPGCKKSDPNSVEDQVERLQKAKNNKERLAAIERLRSIGKKEAVPGLVEALKANPGEVREKIAVALGDIKDTSATAALSESIDFAVTSGSDKASQQANSANKEIARALGEIGDKAATEALLKLLKVTKDQYVKIETINALGKLKDPRSVELLSEIATDERIEPYINKKAIMALSQINDPRALPAYFKMAFAERKGVSFYPESSFAIFLLGDAANDKILKVLAGEDKDLLAWAKERDILEPAIYAKAAQIESDLQDRRAIPHLVKLLKFEDDNPRYKLIVRMNAADALGRMRAKEGVGPISAMLTEEEANTRGAYMRSLVQIGEKSVVPSFIKCAASGSWSARDYCVLGLAMLGEEKDLKA
ncbi:MAG: HEAT repeat domain-containing protein, partial [Myxococcales bacterium]